jgi:hypothetical protein
MQMRICNHSDTQVRLETLDDDGRCLAWIYFDLNQLDQLMGHLGRFRTSLATARTSYRHAGHRYSGTHSEHREAGPASFGMSPSGNSGWDGGGGGGYGGGACGNGA